MRAGSCETMAVGAPPRGGRNTTPGHRPCPPRRGIDASPGEKRVLQQASVRSDVLAGPLLRPVAAATEALLRALEGRGLVQARPSVFNAGQLEYNFQHVLIRDVACASLPKAGAPAPTPRRPRSIEQLAGDRVDEFDELLASPYSAALAGEDADLAWAGAADARERIRRRAF